MISSALSVMACNRGWIWVLLCFWVFLWRQLVHLFVHFLSLWIHNSLLFQSLVLDSSCLPFLEHLCLLHKRSLKLSWLWVESVIVCHLLIKVGLLEVSCGESTKQSEILHLSNVFEHVHFRRNIDLVDLGKLQSAWDQKQ